MENQLAGKEMISKLMEVTTAQIANANTAEANVERGGACGCGHGHGHDCGFCRDLAPAAWSVAAVEFGVAWMLFGALESECVRLNDLGELIEKVGKFERDSAFKLQQICECKCDCKHEHPQPCQPPCPKPCQVREN